MSSNVDPPSGGPQARPSSKGKVSMWESSGDVRRRQQQAALQPDPRPGSTPKQQQQQPQQRPSSEGRARAPQPSAPSKYPPFPRSTSLSRQQQKPSSSSGGPKADTTTSLTPSSATATSASARFIKNPRALADLKVTPALPRPPPPAPPQQQQQQAPTTGYVTVMVHGRPTHSIQPLTPGQAFLAAGRRGVPGPGAAGAGGGPLAAATACGPQRVAVNRPQPASFLSNFLAYQLGADQSAAALRQQQQQQGGGPPGGARAGGQQRQQQHAGAADASLQNAMSLYKELSEYMPGPEQRRQQLLSSVEAAVAERRAGVSDGCSVSERVSAPPGTRSSNGSSGNAAPLWPPPGAPHRAPRCEEDASRCTSRTSGYYCEEGGELTASYSSETSASGSSSDASSSGSKRGGGEEEGGGHQHRSTAGEEGGCGEEGGQAVWRSPDPTVGVSSRERRKGHRGPDASGRTGAGTHAHHESQGSRAPLHPSPAPNHWPPASPSASSCPAAPAASILTAALTRHNILAADHTRGGAGPRPRPASASSLRVGSATSSRPGTASSLRPGTASSLWSNYDVDYEQVSVAVAC